MKATRTDVAKLAGTSTATVSNVLNNSSKVKGETILRVKNAIESLNYKPNMIARSLSTNRTMQVGVVLEDIRNPHYGEIVQYFEAKAMEYGYFVNICTDPNELDRYFENFIARGLDGVFVAALPHHFDCENLYKLNENGIKIVVSGNENIDFRRVSSIDHNFADAMRKAIDYLVHLGHRDIAYISALGKELSNDVRCATYLEYVQTLGLPCADKLFVNGRAPFHTTAREGYEQAQRLLKQGNHLTAAICGNDLMAIGAIKAFSEHGLSVPDDISVIGFDGISLGRFAMPSITTMAVDQRAFGEKVFEILYNNMNKGITGYYRTNLTLVEGGSTAPRK